MIGETGIWSQDLADSVHYRAHSNTLLKFMADFFDKGETVIDFGCGDAFYVAELEKQGFDVLGIEGEKLNNFKTNEILVADLTHPLTLGMTGNVISLEVIEHIPEQFEQIFLDTITSHCKSKLIFSWALPGQPGEGHVNCKPKEYAISEIEKRGFKFLIVKTAEARMKIEENCDWFRRTLLIFERVG